MSVPLDRFVFGYAGDAFPIEAYALVGARAGEVFGDFGARGLPGCSAYGAANAAAAVIRGRRGNRCIGDGFLRLRCAVGYD